VRLERSISAFARARRSIAGGVNSPVRAFKSVGGTPVFMKAGSGARLFDLDDHEYIDYVLSRITVIGAAYLAVVCLLPEMLISYASVPFYFGGTSLLIVVSVTMDTVAQIQGYLLAHQYEGLIKRSKLRGRRR